MTTLVSNGSAVSSTTSPLTITVSPTGTVAGNLCVVKLAMPGYTVAPTFTFPANWIQGPVHAYASGACAQIWYLKGSNNPGGITTISVSFTGGTKITGGVVIHWGEEYSGIDTSAPLDLSVGGHGTTTPYNITGTPTAAANELAVDVLAVYNSTAATQTINPGTGFTQVTNSGNGTSSRVHGAGDYNLSTGTSGSTVSDAGSFTTAATAYAWCLATFKPLTLVSGTAAVMLKKMSVSASGNTQLPPLNSNTGFESGTSPWSANGANATLTQITSWSASGTHSGQVSVTASGGFPGLVSETIPVASNRNYKFKATVESPSPFAIQAGVHWYDDTSSFISSDYQELTLTAGTAQVFGPNVVTAPSNAVAAVLFAQYDGTASTGVVFNVDEISLAAESATGTIDVTFKKMTVSGVGYAAIPPLVQESAAAETLSPSFPKATKAGNLLVAWLGSNDSSAIPPFSTSSPGWVIAFQAGGAFDWFAIAYKENCSAGETAPTFSNAGGSAPFSKLAEFSGMALSSVLDQTAGANTSGTSFSAQAPAGDSQSGDLIIGGVYCNSPSTVATASAAMTDSSGASVTAYEDTGQPGGTGTILYDFVWGVAGGTTGSSGDKVVVTISAFTGGTAGIASFKTPSSGVTGTSSVTLKKMTIVASGNSVDSGTASGTFWKMTVSASGAVYDKGTSAAVLKKITVSGTATAPVVGAGVLVLKKMTTFGQGKAKISGTTDVTIQKMTVSGTGLVPIFGTANVILRKMQIRAGLQKDPPLFVFSLF